MLLFALLSHGSGGSDFLSSLRSFFGIRNIFSLTSLYQRQVSQLGTTDIVCLPRYQTLKRRDRICRFVEVVCTLSFCLFCFFNSRSRVLIETKLLGSLEFLLVLQIVLLHFPITGGVFLGH